MREIRIGIIGVGQIGKHHLEQYRSVPGARVVAACDIDAPELARVAERYGIESTYADYRQLLERDDLDSVDVCLHNNLHAPVTIAALESGKHVYCEKPMAGAFADAQAMMDVSVRCGKMLSIQLGTLFTNENLAALAIRDAGMLGKLYHARSVGFRRRGRPFVDGYGTENFVKKHVAAGGALYDMGVYHIAQVLFLLGLPKVERISGKVYQETPMDEVRRTSSGYDVEELGLGFVKCHDGLTIDIIEAWAMHLGGLDSSCILGSQGGLKLDPFGYFTTTADLEVSSSFDLGEVSVRRHRLDPDRECYDSAQHHWIGAQQGRVPLWPTAETALNTMLISEGIYLSNRLGREVTADEVRQMSVSTALKI